jgi:hypothetical protein
VSDTNVSDTSNASAEQAQTVSERQTAGRTCQKCGAPLGAGQDWCLQCGAAAPGSLGPGGPGWRSAAVVLGATAVLVLGAAAAAYAALSQPSAHKPAAKVITIAQAPTASTSTIPTTPGATSTPTATTPAPITPTTSKPLGGTTTPPKIPLTAPTPKSSGATPTKSSTTKTTTEPGTGTSKSKGENSGESGEPSSEGPTPILLDTNAASTYNPYNLPTSSFGDPSLAIDGETSTGWTAQVEPSNAPHMAVGLAIDLHTPQRVGAIVLVTSTPGMTVQVYGSNTAQLPASITDPAWVTLSPSLRVKKHHTHIDLHHSAKAFRFITLWISAAPQSSVGTPTAPGHVSVNELELFPTPAK